jgi:hypothetical protein
MIRVRDFEMKVGYILDVTSYDYLYVTREVRIAKEGPLMKCRRSTICRKLSEVKKPVAGISLAEREIERDGYD